MQLLSALGSVVMESLLLLSIRRDAKGMGASRPAPGGEGNLSDSMRAWLLVEMERFCIPSSLI